MKKNRNEQKNMKQGNRQKKPEAWSYVRVSTLDQSEDRQIDAMHGLGIDDAHIVLEKRSGKDFNRPEYQKLVKKLKEGDVLYIHSLDRLGRNYSQIQEEWRFLTREKKINIVVLDMPLLDTRQYKDLIGTLISDLVLELFAYVAETERQSISIRTTQGLAAAKARGVRLGRPAKEFDEAFIEIYREWKEGKISAGEAARRCGLPKSTFRYRARVLGERGRKRRYMQKKEVDVSVDLARTANSVYNDGQSGNKGGI